MRQLLFKHSIGAYICIEWPRLAVGHQRNNSSIEWHTNDRCRRSLGWKNRSNFRFINYNYSIWISKQTHIIWVRILSHFAREYVSTLQWKYNWNGNGWIMHDVIAYLNLSTLTSLYSPPNHRITMVYGVYGLPISTALYTCVQCVGFLSSIATRFHTHICLCYQNLSNSLLFSF